MQTKTVRVLRAFFLDGKPTKVGTTIELPAVFALEMCAAHKAELVQKPAAAPVVRGADGKTAENPKGAKDAG